MKTYMLAACLTGALLAAGCGNDTNDTNNGMTSPSTGSGTGTGTSGGGGTTGCTQATVAERTKSDLGRDAWEPLAFKTSSEGRVDITVSWENPKANVGAFLVNAGSCTQAQFQGQQCSFLLASGEDNPHQMTAQLPAGDYELLIQDFGGTSRPAERVAATVVLSTGTGCPAFPSAGSR